MNSLYTILVPSLFFLGATIMLVAVALVAGHLLGCPKSGKELASRYVAVILLANLACLFISLHLTNWVHYGFVQIGAIFGTLSGHFALKGGA